MKIALLADPHLSDVENTPQEEALNWALAELAHMKPDACVWLGDITACGDPYAAMRFYKKIRELTCPSVVVPGNSDLRTEATAPIIERYLFSHPEGLKIGDIHIVGMDTAHDRILASERERLTRLETGERILLCSHQPAKYLDEASVNFLHTWIAERQKKGQEILLWASGHRHVYQQGSFDGISALSVRALDLDKCSGGSAQICLWDSESGAIEERVYFRGLPEAWSEEERTELADALGITCYNRTKLERDMPFAIGNRVRHLEWRSIAEGDLPLIEEWRRAGGQSFSLHMPSLNFDGTAVMGLPQFQNAARDAVRAAADMITVHPPQIPNERFGMDSPAFDAVADAMAEAFLPVVGAGIDILVENNHTDFGTPNDPMKCAYGCTPLELTSWCDALTARLGAGSCHLRLDVGHARNNLPRSKEYPIGKWYAMVGSEVRSYHLHQTIHNKETNRMHNHHPITGWHDSFISFDGFLWAWHTGILRRAPIILEIREGEGAPATWQRLQHLIRQGT